MAADGAPKGLPAHVWRDASGDVAFLEVGGDFVGALQRVLQEPLGSMLRGCSSGAAEAPTHPLLALASSAPKVLPAPAFPVLDWTSALYGGGAGQQACAEKHGRPWQKKQQRPQDCLRCLKEYGTRRAVLPGSHCEYCNSVWTPKDYCHTGAFTAAFYCPSCGADAAVDGSDGTCTNCGSQRVPTFVHVLSWPHCARCVAASQGGPQMRGYGHCSNCGGRGVPACPQCGHCDACSLDQLGYAPPGAPSAPAIAEGAGDAPPHLQGAFLITNSLEVSDASPARVAELSSARCPAELPRRELVSVTPDRLREMVLRGLLGSSEVLAQTFPPRAWVGQRARCAGHRGAGGDRGKGDPEARRSRSTHSGSSENEAKTELYSAGEDGSSDGSFVESYSVVTQLTSKRR